MTALDLPCWPPELLWHRGERPLALAADAGQWSWLTGASLAGPALLAAAVAGTVAAAPWLSRPWRRTAWAALWLAAVARLITGTARRWKWSWRSPPG
jgi:hypothetical protein